MRYPSSYSGEIKPIVNISLLDDDMSAYNSKKKNSVYPSSDNHLSVHNGSGGGKRKPSPRRSKSPKPSRLWTEEIQALKPCDQFFIKQTNMQTEDSVAPSNYDIRNGSGKLVFKAIESVDPAIRDLYSGSGKPPFVLTIFDMKAGKEMLRVNANLRQGVMLVYVRQATEDKIIGIIRRVHSRCPCCSSNFSLERPNGAVLLKIRSSLSPSNYCCCSCPFFKKQGRSFHILLCDDVTHVGKIGYSQKKFDKIDDVEASRREAMVTASFPIDTTATNKALLLASAFMLDNIYFQKGRIPRKRPKVSKTCYIVLTIVTIVSLIAVLAIIFGGGGYQGSRGGRRPFHG